MRKLSKVLSVSRACRVFEKYLDIYPENLELHVDLAQLEILNLDLWRAKSILQRALRLCNSQCAHVQVWQKYTALS